ncbi:class F sortase [Streptoalloteichus hindustanus]|uniref:Sortase family protein n=1 Tax=Streptoalloteichus hindustanus TaxID=2017 RepID=A0A1M4YA05_STRHI|nr:class F sortase [Streptoalloteichus hindustanus]SHF02574.1 Sortase family protein [Streptoalloteichus hindustanus]
MTGAVTHALLGRGRPGAATTVSALGAALAALGTVLVLSPARTEDIGELSVARPTPATSTRPMVGPLPPTSLPVPTGTSASAPPTSAPPPPTRVAPSWLRLPTLGITAFVEPARVHPDGSLAVPRDPRKVGWWTGGAAPTSATGTMMIAGHVDDVWTGEGAFFQLRNLPLGAPVEVDTPAGRHHYRVVARRTHPKWALPRALFDPNGPHRLALVTCAGPFDEVGAGYPDNLVVYADPVPPPG